MKILVPIKRVIDPYVKIRVQPDEKGVIQDGVKKSINPFDEIALEQAIRFKEKGLCDEVVAVSIGLIDSQETLRHALALGADRAILIETSGASSSLHVAKILQKITSNEQPDLVLMGKQSIDGDNNQTPQMLAALLDWPQATYCSDLEMKESRLYATREVDGGLEVISVELPAIVSVDLRLNTPRYASLPNIMQAKRKPLEILSLETLGLSLREHTKRIRVSPPEKRPPGVILHSVEELVEKLRLEADMIGR